MTLYGSHPSTRPCVNLSLAIPPIIEDGATMLSWSPSRKRSQSQRNISSWSPTSQYSHPNPTSSRFSKRHSSFLQLRLGSLEISENQEEDSSISAIDNTNDELDDNQEEQENNAKEIKCSLATGTASNPMKSPPAVCRAALPPKRLQLLRLSALKFDEGSPRMQQRLQTLTSSTGTPSKRHWTTADRICAEIYTTEQTYVKDLHNLLTHFFEPLQAFATKEGIDLGALSALHTSIKSILSIHEELLRLCQGESYVLEQEEEEEEGKNLPSGMFFNGPKVHVPQLCAAFAATIEYMKIYAFYCASYAHAKDALAKLQRKHAGLNALTTQLNEQACRELHLDIVSHMIKPVQRICRYPLLFRELLKNAPIPDEVALLQQMLHQIERVSAHVNDKVRQEQHNARLYQLFQSLDPKAKVELLLPSRTLLYETMGTIVNIDAPKWPAFLVALRRRWYYAHRDDRLTMNQSSSRGILSPVTSPERNARQAENVLLADSSNPVHLRHLFGEGDKVRLILLSDVLLVAKKREQKLKIRRQLCLSCAVIDTSADADEQHSDHGATAFVLHVSKVGQCNCHTLTPSTLKRSPIASSLSSSIFTTSSHASINNENDSISSRELDETTLPQLKRKTLSFNYSEFVPFRTVKRYVVICASEDIKNEFTSALRHAIARCARKAETSSRHSTGFPRKLWHTLKQTTDLPQSIRVTGGWRRSSTLLRHANDTEEEVRILPSYFALPHEDEEHFQSSSVAT